MLDVLGTASHLSFLGEVFDKMVQRLGTVAVDVGVHTGGGAAGLLEDGPPITGDNATGPQNVEMSSLRNPGAPGPKHRRLTADSF